MAEAPGNAALVLAPAKMISIRPRFLYVACRDRLGNMISNTEQKPLFPWARYGLEAVSASKMRVRTF